MQMDFITFVAGKYLTPNQNTVLLAVHHKSITLGIKHFLFHLGLTFSAFIKRESQISYDAKQGSNLKQF